MGRSFRRIALSVATSLAVPLLLASMGRSQTSDPIMLSEQETKTIGELLTKPNNVGPEKLRPTKAWEIHPIKLLAEH